MLPNTKYALLLATTIAINLALCGFLFIGLKGQGMAAYVVFLLLLAIGFILVPVFVNLENKEEQELITKNADAQEYETILSQLSTLALCLPAKPDKEDLLHFLDLEEQAEKHETEIDIRKGITGRTAVTTELDEMALFQMSRCARRNGKTTNEYILEQVAKTMKAEQNENANR